MEDITPTEPKGTPTGPCIVFIGRSSAAPQHSVKRDWLLETLHWVEQIHMQEYGSLDSRSVDYIPFIQSSNRPLPLGGEVMTKLSAVFQKARANAGCGVILVISGWDGLTTNDGSLAILYLKSEGIDVTLRFYVEESDSKIRHFRDVKFQDAYRALNEDIMLNDGDSSLKAFCESYRGIQANKHAQAQVKKELNELSFRRNCFPRPENFARWACTTPGCGKVYKSLVDLTSHRGKSHRVWSDETKANWLICSFCQEEFSEPWSRDRHLKINCPKNPESEKNKPASKPRKKRGTMVRVAGVEDQPEGSDNGLKPYLSIDPADFHKAPRIDPENPIIYRGEVFCRHPDCSSKKVTRYTQKSIVRKHYRKEHGMEYRQFSRTLGTFDEQPHIDGLQWISICVQRGQEQAGTAPVPRKW
ncbi:hypothetical protein PCG10_008503 [Penicillium crustosum]|uniref:C2H2-type domain-containing protein n=1 Tax=Penicillium crustosum TaxID=36656 RepID=A0A9P5GK55_PENCR|nr:uncharacterized protein N7487_003788 [Penicillium crustosum]KAF7521099.1 hypothetical protein PCG10_008503 [Penicillium crustosum]KAJ5409429.1 hypothetical protein N7487_003788 [Penicillium crustosum]